MPTVASKSPFRDVESAFKRSSQNTRKRRNATNQIIFRKGTYYFDKGFLIDQSLSNLIITAYPEESVIFFGRETDTGKSHPAIPDRRQ